MVLFRVVCRNLMSHLHISKYSAPLLLDDILMHQQGIGSEHAAMRNQELSTGGLYVAPKPTSLPNLF